MSEREWSAEYETAIRRLQEHLTQAEDGTFRLNVEDGRSLGIDPIVFADLTRSLEEMNKLIRRGELDAKEVEFMPLKN
jgi:hypothetical protein